MQALEEFRNRDQRAILCVMSLKLIAIDVLLELDELVSQRAKEANAAILRNYPAGFLLDESHTPHVTLIQRYIEYAALETVATAVSQVVKLHNASALKLEIAGFESWPRTDPDLETVMMIVNRSDDICRLQRAIIDAVQPLAASGGTAEAFAPNVDGTPINRNIVTYVEHFLPDNAGDNYRPHVTIGFAHANFAHEFCSRPFASFTFTPPAVAIYQLGSFGTARVKLWP